MTILNDKNVNKMQNAADFNNWQNIDHWEMCHINIPSLLESTNTICWFLGFSATSAKCKLAFNFSIF